MLALVIGKLPTTRPVAKVCQLLLFVFGVLRKVACLGLALVWSDGWLFIWKGLLSLVDGELKAVFVVSTVSCYKAGTALHACLRVAAESGLRSVRQAALLAKGGTRELFELSCNLRKLSYLVHLLLKLLNAL